MRVRRGDLRDVYSEDGRTAVFVNDQVIVLSEVASVILEATPATGSVSIDELTTEVVAAVGPPETHIDARDVVARQVHDLVAHHVLSTDQILKDPLLTPAAVEALRECLRHSLSSNPVPWIPPTTVTGDEILVASQRHRVTPTLARSLERLIIPSSTMARISAVADNERATVSVLAADLAKVVQLLADQDIRCLSFKGLALAVQAHGDVSARGTGDLDLLVHPHDLERAHRALAMEGWTPSPDYPDPDGGWAWAHHMRTGFETTLISRTSSVDLHWWLGPTRSAFPSFVELWARSVRVNVMGETIPTLAPYDALAHSASHAARDGWAWMRGLVDVHLLMSDPDTWRTADRPLRHDQLLTVGIAARMFGIPDGSPQIIERAAELVATVWEAALARQATGGAAHQASRVPGVALLRGLRTLRWAGADSTDVVRHLGYSAMPPWLTADQAATHVTVAVPRVLARRTRAFTRRARRSTLV